MDIYTKNFILKMRKTRTQLYNGEKIKARLKSKKYVISNMIKNFLQIIHQNIK